MISTESDNTVNNDSDINEGWLVYAGSNHQHYKDKDSMDIINKPSDLNIFRTYHGVILKKKDSHAWIFVSDYSLIGGIDKLRWKSIDKVQIIGRYAIVQINGPGVYKYYFVINIEKGVSGRLRLETPSYYNFKIEDGKLIIRDPGSGNSKPTTHGIAAPPASDHGLVFKLEKLFAELDKDMN